MFFFSYSRVIDPLLRNIRIFVPKFAGMKSGNKVLDVCCGTGDQVFYYAKAGIVAFGIDLDQNMIRVARGDKRNKETKNVSFQVADAVKLPFEDNFFNYASISFALHEKERDVRSKIISEMKRVVKEGGILVFVDYQSPMPGNFFSYLIRLVERFAGKDHFNCFKDYIRQGGLYTLLSENRLREEKRKFFMKRNVVAIRARNI